MDSSVSLKIYLNAVRMCRGDLATEVFSNGLSMPAVLIGDAAHAIPQVMSAYTINQTIWDAFQLCSMIVDRYDNDMLFSRITKDFYDAMFGRWNVYTMNWAEDWLTAHGLPYDSYKAYNTWVRLARSTHRVAKQHVPEAPAESVTNEQKEALIRYIKNERTRMGLLEQRIRAR